LFEKLELKEEPCDAWADSLIGCPPRFQHVTIEALIGWPLASLIQILVQVF
jgi:hypothetical protein